MRYYEGDSLESDGKKWEVVFATTSVKGERFLLLKSEADDWAIATDNLDGTLRDLELLSRNVYGFICNITKGQARLND